MESVASSGDGVAVVAFFSCQKNKGKKHATSLAMNKIILFSDFFIGVKLRTSIVIMPHKNKCAPLKNHASR